MAYLAPIHRPSSVRYAIKLNLLDPDVECLVIAKGPRLEIWQQADDTFVMTDSHQIYGSITMLAKFRTIGAQTDHLFVGTQQLQYFTLGLNKETEQLETKQRFEDTADKYLQNSQSRDLCMVDPTGRFLVLALFEGVLNLINIMKPRKGRVEDLGVPEQTRISETKVRSMTFLHTETKQAKIAFLIQDTTQHGDVRLVTYRLVDEKMAWASFDPQKNRENDIGDLDAGASHLIPVAKGDGNDKRHISRNSTSLKAHLGGVLVVGETKFTYLDDESKAVVEYALDIASVFVAWEELDNLTYVLGDDFGILHLLTIQVEGSEVVGMDLQKIGRTSKATVIVNYGEGIIFLGSHEGDSQFLKLDIEATRSNPDTGDGLGHITVIQEMPNIAPISDFAVMDMGGREGETQSNEYSTGQARIVTGSGVYESGSFRSVRSGVGLEDVGILTDDIEDVLDVFSLKTTPGSEKDDTLVVSLAVETRVFRFIEGDIEEVEEFRNLQLDQPTLLAMNLPNGFILQITSESVRIIGPDSSPSSAGLRWSPPPNEIITTASANENHVFLACNGINLILLDVKNGLSELAEQHLSQDDQVACIHVPKDIPNVGIVGFWKSGSVSILDLRNLDILWSEDTRRKNVASIPRNITMTQVLPPLTSGPTLFIAMEDGIVLTFAVNKTSFHLSGRKSIVLGTQQARFHVLPQAEGRSNVFATCEHPSLIYGTEGRIVYSAVTADNAICVCPFDSEDYPNSIVIVGHSSLKISRVDDQRRTHVRTTPIGSTVRKIAYSPSERAFGIGCVSRKIVKGDEVITNTFQLVEDMMFGPVGSPYKLDDSNGPEVIECVIRTEIPTTDSMDEPEERFIVGTTFLSDDQAELNRRGRILVFGINDQKSPYLITSLNLKCACRRLAMLGDKIVAVLYKTVVVYNYNETAINAAELTKSAAYRCVTVPMDISVTGNTIAIADMMQSLSIVEFRPGKDGLPDTLEQVARDYTPCWSTAVMDIDNDCYLESDHDGNLIVLRRNKDGITAEDRKRMEIIGEMHLGEQVNAIRRIQVEPGQNAMVAPKAFMATTEGSIYLLSTILPSSQSLLLSLQERCQSYISTLGLIPFKRFRAYKSGARECAEPYRFVDGELIERFLDVGEEVQEMICEGLGRSAEDIRGVVEELKRLH